MLGGEADSIESLATYGGDDEKIISPSDYIEKGALAEVGGPLAAPTAPRMADVDPNGRGEPVGRSGAPAL